MRVSREQVAENRHKILDAASRLFRERGFDGVSVADVMSAAGLTHGGFYGYFQSKDDLIARTLEHVAERSREGDANLARFASRYLSPAHRDDIAGGCPIAALGADAVRQSPEARAALAEGLKRQIERFARDMRGMTPAAARRAAIGSWAAMVGAMLFARLSDDAAMSDEVLNETYAWIMTATQRAAN